MTNDVAVGTSTEPSRGIALGITAAGFGALHARAGRLAIAPASARTIATTPRHECPTRALPRAESLPTFIIPDTKQLVLRPRRSARAVPEDSAGVGGGEAPVDLTARAIGRLVPEPRAVLELTEGRDSIAAGALA